MSGMSEAGNSSVRPSKAAATKAPNGKQRIVEAAERLFAGHGFSGVSAAEIAKAAGVAHGLLFHHFGAMDDLYAEVSRVAAERMDDAQLMAFRGKTARDQILSFMRTHMRAVKQREGDAIFRARGLDAGVNKKVVQIWETSRQRAIDRVFESMGIKAPTKKMRVCLRAWLGFHDQLVLGWLADRSLSEAEVLQWTMDQLDQLAATILGVDLDLAVDPR